jgi:hypothetical protein
MKIGQTVTLIDEIDCIIPAGTYRISKMNADGSFHVGGNTAVWPHRIVKMSQIARPQQITNLETQVFLK